MKYTNYIKKEDALLNFGKLKSPQDLTLILTITILLLTLTTKISFTTLNSFSTATFMDKTEFASLILILRTILVSNILLALYAYYKLLTFDMKNSEMLKFIRSKNDGEMLSLDAIGKLNKPWVKTVFMCFLPPVIAWLLNLAFWFAPLFLLGFY